MSHFAVMVAIPNAKNRIYGESKNTELDGEFLDDILKEMLAPFQENNMGNCPEEFLEFNDTEEENKEEYEAQTWKGYRKKQKNGQFRHLSKFDKEIEKITHPVLERMRKEKEKQGKELDLLLGLNNKDEELAIALEVSKALAKKGWEKVKLPMKEVYATFEQFMANWHGSKERDPKTGKYGYWENARRYAIALCPGVIYNPISGGIINDKDMQGLRKGKATGRVSSKSSDTGRKGGVLQGMPKVPENPSGEEKAPSGNPCGAPGEEVLPGLQEDKAHGGLLDEQEVERRKVHLLQDLHKPEEQEPSSDAKTRLVSEGEVSAPQRKLQQDGEEAEGKVCDLRGTSYTNDQERSSTSLGGRSQPFDRGSQGTPMRELQHDVGERERQSPNPPCGNPLPHPAHEYETGILVKGSMWDFWTLGGRWSGHLRIKEGVEPIRGERSWTNEKEKDDPHAADAAYKEDIDFEGLELLTNGRIEEFWKALQGCIEAYKAGNEKKAENFDVRTTLIDMGIVTGREPMVTYVNGLTLEDLKTKYRPHFEWGTYAYLDENGWREPGKMGWWGCSSATPETLVQQQASFMEWLKSKPDGTLFAVVDCHI
jgi:hypothetical protein